MNKTLAKKNLPLMPAQTDSKARQRINFKTKYFLNKY